MNFSFRDEDLECKIQARFVELYSHFSDNMISFPYNFFTPVEWGGCHIEYNFEKEISIVASERNIRTKLVSSKNIDDIMYWIFVEFCESDARKEIHRTVKSDPRRFWFKKSEEKIASISKLWAHRLSRDHQDILTKNPFVDV